MSDMYDRTQIDVLTENAVRKITAHVTRCLKKITEKFDYYNPKNQLSLKKALLAQLPKKPMRMEIYMDVVSMYIREHDVQITPAEYEAFLHRLGVIRKDRVCYGYNANLVDKILLIL